MYDFAMNIYHHWSQLITQETKLQKWSLALQLEASKVEKKTKQARLDEKDIAEQVMQAAEKMADAEKFETELRAREESVRREGLMLKRRQKKVDEQLRIHGDREGYFEELEADMDKKWKDLEKSRYEFEQERGKHEREWSDVKHMMEKVKNWEHEVRREKDECEREQGRLREVRASVEKDRTLVADNTAKLNRRMEKLEAKEDALASIERDYQQEKQKKLESLNTKEVQVSRLSRSSRGRS